MSLIAYSVIIGWLLLIIERTNGTCPYTNRDHPGSDINPHKTAIDWKECAHQCQNTASCKGWVWSSNSGNCYRKNGWSGESGLTYSSGAYAGPRSCGCAYKNFYTSWTTSSNPQCDAGDTAGPIETRTVNGQKQYRRECRKTVIYIWTSWKTGSVPSCPEGYYAESQERRWKLSAFQNEYRRKCYQFSTTCYENANIFDYNDYDDVDKYNWNLWDIVIISILTASMVICLYHLMCKLCKICYGRKNKSGYKHVKTIYDTDTDIEMVENKPINQ